MTSPFQSVTAEQLAHAKEVCSFDHLPVCNAASISRRRGAQKNGCETWSCAWAPDHSYLAWSAGHRMVRLIPWDSKLQKKHDANDLEGLNGREYHVIHCGETVHSLAFAKTNRNCYKQRWKRQRCSGPLLVLATGHVSGRIKLWNCETGKLLVEILDHKDIVHDLHFAQDDCLCLTSASQDGTVKLWEFDENGDCNMYLTIRTNAKHTFSCQWSPDRKYVAAAGSFKTALLFRIQGRKVLESHRLEGHYHDVVHCDFSPDGALLATASCDTRVILWDVDTRTMLAQLGHMHPSPRPIYAGGANDHYVYSVQFSPDGTRLATVAEDGYLRVWQMPDLTDPVTIATVDGARCCSFSADGHLVAVGTVVGSLSIRSTPRGGPDCLMHKCRRVIRGLVGSESLGLLPLPNSMQMFLAYKDVKSENVIW
ncbi:hypothetical protein ACOMHN_056727 [Nucella lapillus]